MDLFDVINFFENSDWVRVVVTDRGDENMISYKTTSQKSITINEETYTETNRVCLRHKDNEVYLYINNLLRRNLNKINIEDILNITIP